MGKITDIKRFLDVLEHVPKTVKSGTDAYPETQLNGAGMKAFIRQIKARSTIPRIHPILERYSALQILDAKAEIDSKWYPRQLYLDMSATLTEFIERVAVGRAVEKTLIFPDDTLTSPADIAHLLQEAYELNQRNIDPNDKGYILHTVTAGKHIQILDTTPYNAHMNYGYIHGMLHRLKDKYSFIIQMLDPYDMNAVVSAKHQGAVIFDIQYEAK